MAEPDINNTSQMRLEERLRRIRLLVMDVDGVLTDGGVYFLEDGRQLRRFNIKDGLGLRRVMAAGVQVAWISADSGSCAVHRAQHLGVEDAFFGVKDKLAFLTEFCLRREIPLEQAAYIGDDLTDLGPLGVVGLPCAPADAVCEVRAVARYVTWARGGEGAVRELCDLILNSQCEGEA